MPIPAGVVALGVCILLRGALEGGREEVWPLSVMLVRVLAVVVLKSSLFESSLLEAGRLEVLGSLSGCNSAESGTPFVGRPLKLECRFAGGGFVRAAFELEGWVCGGRGDEPARGLVLWEWLADVFGAVVAARLELACAGKLEDGGDVILLSSSRPVFGLAPSGLPPGDERCGGTDFRL